jgi:hypothetical protein
MKGWIFLWTAVCCGGFSAGFIGAETVTLTANDAGGTSAFSKNNWSDGLVPHSGTDYLVVGDSSWNFAMRTPETASGGRITFGGDSLTIGVVGGNWSSVNDKTSGSASLYFKALTLANGYFVNGMNDSTEYVTSGVVNVTSPASARFFIVGATNRVLLFQGPLNGTQASGLGIDGQTTPLPKTPFLFYPMADNSAYLGSWLTQKNGILMAGRASSLGGAPSAFDAASITLSNNGGIGAANGVTLAVDNRGITVTGVGGTLYAGSGAAWTLAMPLTGSAPVNKVGAGTVVVSNSWSGTGMVTVQAGSLSFATNAILADGAVPTFAVRGGRLSLADVQLRGRALSVSNGYFNAVGFGVIGEATLSSATFLAGGGIEADVDDGTKTSDCVHLVAGVTFPSGPLPVRLACTDAGSAGRYAVLTIPTSVKTVTANDFTNTTDPGVLGLVKTAGAVEVETDGDGLQTVYITRTSTVVRQISTHMPGQWWMTANTWSDGLAAHSGADYLGTQNAFRSPEVKTEAVFPGDSLTLDAVSGLAQLVHKGTLATFNDLRIGRNVHLGASSGGVQTLKGSFTLLDFDNNWVILEGSSSRTLVLDADIVGKAGFRAIVNLLLPRQNPAFTGPVFVTSGCTLLVNDELNLGGNPASYNAAQLSLSKGILAVTNSVTLDDANRGIYIDSQGGTFNVATGATLTVRNRLSLYDTLNKTGDGILALGPATVSANGKTIEVKAGSFKPLTAGCIGNGILTLDAGTTLLLAAAPEDATLAASGIVASNNSAIQFTDNLSVGLDVGDRLPSSSFTVPVCTVNTTAAAALRGHILIATKLSGFTSSVTEEAVTESTVRYSLRYTNNRGTQLFLK